MYTYLSLIHHCTRHAKEHHYSIQEVRYFYRAWNVAYHALIAKKHLFFDAAMYARRMRLILRYEQETTARMAATLALQMRRDMTMISSFIEFYKEEREMKEEEFTRAPRLPKGMLGWEVFK